MFHYDYRSGSTEGDNTKLRRAGELGLPVFLLRRIRTGVYVPVLPTYVVKDDLASHRFVIAVDESLRFMADPLSARCTMSRRVPIVDALKNRDRCCNSQPLIIAARTSPPPGPRA
jgi:hypothetical protein